MHATSRGTPIRPPDPEAAAAAVAHTTLVYLFPDNRADLDAAPAQSIGHIEDGPAKEAGLRLGALVGINAFTIAKALSPLPEE